MQAPDLRGAVEIGEGAGQFQHPMIAARREAHALGGVPQQGEARRVEGRRIFDHARGRGGVGGHPGQAHGAVALPLKGSGDGDPLGHIRRALGGGGQDEIGGGDGGYVDGEVETVEQGA